MSVAHQVRISKSEIIKILILSVFILGVIFYSSNKYSSSDPLGCLLTSQALLTYGTVKLDAYKEMLKEHDDIYSYRIMTKNDHLFYYFPIGSSIYAVPFVKVANFIGRDMSSIIGNKPIYDTWLQKVLSSLIVTICCFLVYGICRCLLTPFHSIILTLTFVLGSSIASTMGTALWSFDFEVMFILLCLLMIVYDAYNRFKLNVYLLSFCLFSAYLCRPTAAIFIGVVAIYVFFKSRELFIKLTISFLVFFTLFIIFSLHEYTSILPPYYLPQRLNDSRTFWIALFGDLLSPARGIFVYSPYLIVTFFGLYRFRKELFCSRLTWMASCWFILHIVAISRFPQWWGGYSFGPRLLTDAFPACMLLTILVWNELCKTLFSRTHKVVVTIFLCLASVSIIIHTYQGLYNRATVRWNSSPSIDEYPEYLFDWRYPQFMATTKLLKERELYHQQKIRLKNLPDTEK